MKNLTLSLLKQPSLPLFIVGPCLLTSCYLNLLIEGNELVKYRGLFSYFSATIGDAIFLTIAVYYMFYYLNKNSYLKKIQYKPILVVSLISALLITVVIHYLWMSNPNTENNWTIINGSLNIYGVLHGIYFMLMLGSLLYGGICIIVLFNKINLIGCKRELFSSHFEYFITITQALILYSLTLYYDNNNMMTISVLYSPVMFCIFLLGLIFIKYLCIRKRINSTENIKKIIFSLFLIICLIFFTNYLMLSIKDSTGINPIALFLIYILMPLLCFQNYLYNLFKIHKRSITPLFFMSAIVIYLSIASMLAQAVITLSSIKVGMINMSILNGINYIFLLGIFIFLLVMWVINIYEKKRDLTPISGSYNLLQNYLAFFIMMIIILVTIIGTSDEIKTAPFLINKIESYTQYMLTLLWSATTLIIVANFNHLRDWNSGKYNVEINHIVSFHIWMLMIGYGLFLALITVWAIYENMLSIMS